jgi:polysaccharide export outer membrane protein
VDRGGLFDSDMSNGTVVRVCLLAVSLLGLGALGVASPPQASPPQKAAPAPLSQPPSPSPYDKGALSPEYRIAPGDVLQVFVWREPELSREVRVRTDGYLTVTLLGDVFAVAKTPREFGVELAEKLKSFITAPIVTITVVSSSSQRFFVVGEVSRPGDYPLISRTTILQALALAGGFREYAKTDEIKIIRQEVLVGVDKRPFTREIVLPVSYKSLARGQDLQQNLVLKPSDVIVVP